MTKGNIALLEAIKRGYTVNHSGDVFNPNGYKYGDVRQIG